MEKDAEAATPMFLRYWIWIGETLRRLQSLMSSGSSAGRAGRSGALGAYRTRPGSSAPPESLLASRHLGYTGTWTPDGGGLVAVATELRPGSRLDVVRFAPGSTALEPLVATPFNEQYPAVSPDGRWLAYVSDQSGREEVYVRELADADGLSVQVSLGGATEPVWRRDGRELAYRGTTDGRP